jgi:hypothetical protein
MENIFFDYINFDSNNLKTTIPQHFYRDCKKIDVLYNDKKIIIKSPKMQLPFDIKKFGVFFKMAMSFGVISNDNKPLKKFYRFLRVLDDYIKEIVKTKFKKWGYSSKSKYYPCINKSNGDYPPIIITNLPFEFKPQAPSDGNLTEDINDINFMFKVFNENSKEMKITDIKPKTYVSVIMELSDVWISNNECGCNWNILQIKKYNSPTKFYELCLSECLIDDPDDPVKLVIPEKKPVYLPPPPPPPQVTGIPHPPPPPKPVPQKPVGPSDIFRPPTVAELNDMISMMKSKSGNKTIEESINENKAKNMEEEVKSTPKKTKEIVKEEIKPKKKKIKEIVEEEIKPKKKKQKEIIEEEIIVTPKKKKQKEIIEEEVIVTPKKKKQKDIVKEEVIITPKKKKQAEEEVVITPKKKKKQVEEEIIVTPKKKKKEIVEEITPKKKKQKEIVDETIYNKKKSGSSSDTKPKKKKQIYYDEDN